MSLFNQLKNLFFNKKEQYKSSNVILDQVKTLLDENTINSAKKVYNSGSSLPLEVFNVSFRLYKSKYGNVTLETLVRDKYGMYFKPVGYYIFESNNLNNIYILKEFEDEYKQQNLQNNKVLFLTKDENLFIALCSRETSNVVKEMFNSPKYDVMNHMFPNKFQVENLISNGIKIKVKTSMMGTFEAASIDEDYDSDDDIFAMYQNNDGISIHCDEPAYHKLLKQELLSAFK